MKQDRKFRFGLINRVSGEAIPEDEPVFIFRARDLRALKVLKIYRDDCADLHHKLAIQETIAAFYRWQSENPDKLKEPGITRAFDLESDAPDEGVEHD